MKLRVSRRGIPATIDHGKLVGMMDAGELEPLEDVAAVGLRRRRGLRQASHPDDQKAANTKKLVLGFNNALNESDI